MKRFLNVLIIAVICSNTAQAMEGLSDITSHALAIESSRKQLRQAAVDAHKKEKSVFDAIQKPTEQLRTLSIITGDLSNREAAMMKSFDRLDYQSAKAISDLSTLERTMKNSELPENQKASFEGQIMISRNMQQDQLMLQKRAQILATHQQWLTGLQATLEKENPVLRNSMLRSLGIQKMSDIGTQIDAATAGITALNAKAKEIADTLAVRNQQMRSFIAEFPQKLKKQHLDRLQNELMLAQREIPTAQLEFLERQMTNNTNAIKAKQDEIIAANKWYRKANPFSKSSTQLAAELKVLEDTQQSLTQEYAKVANGPEQQRVNELQQQYEIALREYRKTAKPQPMLGGKLLPPAPPAPPAALRIRSSKSAPRKATGQEASDFDSVAE